MGRCYHDPGAAMTFPRTPRSTFLPLLGAVMIALGLVSPRMVRTIYAESQSSPLVIKLTIHDTIQPITADYLKRGLDDAASRHAAAVLSLIHISEPTRRS